MVTTARKSNGHTNEGREMNIRLPLHVAPQERTPGVSVSPLRWLVQRLLSVKVKQMCSTSVSETPNNKPAQIKRKATNCKIKFKDPQSFKTQNANTVLQNLAVRRWLRNGNGES